MNQEPYHEILIYLLRKFLFVFVCLLVLWGMALSLFELQKGKLCLCHRVLN